MLGIRKIDAYIAKRFIVTFFIALLLIIGIVIIFDLSEKIDNFVKNEAPVKAIIFDYYVNWVPYFVNMFSPLFVFITVIFFTSRMAANSEIIAILSSGVSYRRMLVPYIASSIFIAMLSLMLNLYIIPKANTERFIFENDYVVKNVFDIRNEHFQIAPGQFVYIESFSRWNNTAYKFTIENIEDNRLIRKVSCESAAWDENTGVWKLRRVFTRDYSSGLEDKITYKDQIDTVIALKLKDLFNNHRTVEQLSIKDLNTLIDTQKSRGDDNVIYAAIERERRWTLPFSAIILTIIGVTLSSRKKRGGTGWNIVLGIALAFGYILFLRFSEMFVFTDTLPAEIALWLPNVLFTLIAIFLYSRASR